MTDVKNNTQSLSLYAPLACWCSQYKMLLCMAFLGIFFGGSCANDPHGHDGGVSATVSADAPSGEGEPSAQTTRGVFSAASRDRRLDSGVGHVAQDRGPTLTGISAQRPASAETQSQDERQGEGDVQNTLKSAERKDQAQISKDEKQTKREKKKNQRCKRGIHKGRKKCKIQRGHISLYHINQGKRHRDLHLIDDKQRIIPEAREVMLKFLGDWREKTQCKRGYSFNYDYRGRASWRMYKCYVQDRLLWYLYLIGHHFDSEIHILSGLRSKERKSSRHHNGHAVDFRVPGVKAKKVWEYAKRTFPLVGIGYYPKGQFVHLDVGRDHHQAYWVDSSGAGEAAAYKRGVSQVQRGRARKSQGGMIASIQRSLKRHHGKFTTKQKKYLERKRARERARKRREARRKKRRARNNKRRGKRKKRGRSRSKHKKSENKSRTSKN